jgi:hypothetical protein
MITTCPSDHPDRDCEILRDQALPRWDAAAQPAGPVTSRSR